MAQRFDPITQRFQLSGLDSLFQQNPANLASNLLRSGMSPQEVSLQTGVNLDELMLLQRDQMTNVPVQPPMATVPINQTGGITSTLNRDLMGSDPTGELAMMSSQMVDQMDLLGLTKDEDTADALDGVVAAQINASAEKVQSAAASGDAAQLAQAQKDANDVTQLNTSIISFMGNTPEARKEKMNIYREAAATMLGGREDLEKFIRQPDEALPYMVAGMALTQSGEQGDDWITALSNAFSKYAITKKQGEREFEDRYLQFKLNEQMRKEDFATNLALQDLKLQANQLTEKGTPYIVNGGLQILNSMEARNLSRQEGMSIRPYDKDLDGKVSDYTITTSDGSSMTKLLTNSRASQLQGLGFNIVSGNQNKDTKQYQIIYPPDYTPKVGSRLENMPSFINLSESEIKAVREEFPNVDFSDKKVNLVPIIRTIDGVAMPKLVPETQVNYRTDQRQYASESIIVNPETGEVSIVKGPEGSERSLNKSRRDAQADFRSQVNNGGQVFVLLDDILKAADSGADIPSFARGTTNFLQGTLDELKAFSKLIPGLGENLFATAEGVTGSITSGNKGQFSVRAGDLYSDFMASKDAQTLLGKNVQNREYAALTFNLAVSLAKAMGLGEARALSDKDLVFAMRQAGLDSTNRESLVARHNQLRRQIVTDIYRAKDNLENDVYLTGDGKFKKGLNSILNTAIDPLNPDRTFASFYESMTNKGEPELQDAQNQSATTTQTGYSQKYNSFFSSLNPEGNFNNTLERLRKKIAQIENESQADQQTYRNDLITFIRSLPDGLQQELLGALNIE